ncbi:MAG: DNA recombination protein RmuC, partial [Candidatus Paceibacterota bacterium]
EENTLPFAFMYIPAEAIYYDLLVNEVGSIKVNTRNLIDYAYNEKKVIIISPTTFMAYLQSVLYGFKAFKLENDIQDVIKNVQMLSKHIKSYEDYYKRIGKALGTTVSHYDEGSRQLKMIDKDIFRIAGTSPELTLLEVEKPKTEE